VSGFAFLGVLGGSIFDFHRRVSESELKHMPVRLIPRHIEESLSRLHLLAKSLTAKAAEAAKEKVQLYRQGR